MHTGNRPSHAVAQEGGQFSYRGTRPPCPPPLLAPALRITRDFISRSRGYSNTVDASKFRTKRSIWNYACRISAHVSAIGAVCSTRRRWTSLVAMQAPYASFALQTPTQLNCELNWKHSRRPFPILFFCSYMGYIWSIGVFGRWRRDTQTANIFLCWANMHIGINVHFYCFII